MGPALPSSPHTSDGPALPGAATDWNAHLKDRIAGGASELPVPFDWPSRQGYDSDAPTARGRVGAGGVAVDSLDDMRVLFAGLPLDRVAIALTLDPPGLPLLLLHLLVQEERGLTVRRTDVLLRRAHPASPYESRLDGRFRALAAAGRCALVLTAPRPPAPRPPAARPPASGPPGDCAGGRAALALRQAERLAKLRAWRCHERVGAALILLGRSARGPGEDVLGPMCEALEAGASVGEVSAVLRAHWGGDRRPPPGPGGWGRLLPRPPDPIKETELNM